MLSGYAPCHLMGEILIEISQHKRFIIALIYQKEAAYCRLLKISYAC